ncbi:MAG: dihydropteroate synthase [Bacillaceae bacterium]|nr:dihydropteroate synthase [Bacillaceae bacterium]
MLEWKFNPHFLYPDSREELTREMEKIGADRGGIQLMAPKGDLRIIKVENVSLKAANIIKQEMLARGGDAVVHKDVANLSAGPSSLHLIATRRQFQDILKKFKVQPFGIKKLGQEIEALLYQSDRKDRVRRLSCRGKELVVGEKTLVMGILNVTPDSFSDGGKYFDPEQAVRHALEMEEQGADIIDIGGESTRPGAEKVSQEEELQRVIPVIKMLSQKLRIPISIDTYKAEVARQAIEAGAGIINDVWGFKADTNMANVAAEYQVPVILMHNRDDMEYSDLMSDLIRDLRESVRIAREAGVDDHNIILDPGIGFAKTKEHNLEIMAKLDEITGLGYPVLLGTSRKSMIGRVLNLPEDDRLEGTLATSALGITKGCKIIRVHDVKEHVRLSRMMDAMLNWDQEGVTPGHG